MAQFFNPNRGKSRANTSKRQQYLLGEVSKLDHQGRGILRQQGTYFVAGALPGERIRVQTQAKHQARLVEVVEASDERVTPPCPYYQRCGGCDLQHLSLAQQRQHKQQTLAELLSKFAAIEVTDWAPMLTGEGWHYRQRARLASSYARGQRFQLGFRQRASQQVVAIEHCQVLAPPLAALLVPLQQWLGEHYQRIGLGHVELIAQPTPLVLLRVTRALDDEFVQQAEQFAAQHGCQLWSDDGQQTRAITAADEVRLTHHPLPLNFTPGDFIQVNQALNPAMVAQALSWLEATADDQVVELFAGMGNFSLPLAQQVKQLHCFEVSARMIQQLQDNAAAAGLSHVRGHAVDLNHDWLSRLNSMRIDKLLLDPARSGAQAALAQLQQLPAAQRPTRIVYISCAADTLARDSALLKQLGYGISKAGVIDMFPQTHHIEAMVAFAKE
ncbi:23S rRNA (uracil(1939)-C(5))-methyltransferase RlmD [Idiomarina xiamenensis]|uniref:23S rRNA m(5)U1939 methyltransferase n=1 Tax=Idiomarina xiamenensis 10-D-4 TaxID=740709 RepID=K2JMP6_9GAMM|nr:23S rRNA (uracil(1939)-C(5))-methyltransferase RlmD [Idiomarina xiamenensis]EKE84801.1 23S rRNA m(5)U1939 methyltransferase [Idiomarina xiamenensis 10-D-4]